MGGKRHNQGSSIDFSGFGIESLQVCAGGGMPKITLGITGLNKFWVEITGLKNPIGDPHNPKAKRGECSP